MKHLSGAVDLSYVGHKHLLAKKEIIKFYIKEKPLELRHEVQYQGFSLQTIFY